MAESNVVIQEIAVGAGFTASQVEALRKAFEVYEDRVAVYEAAFGDLTGAAVDDTLTADSDGVFQVDDGS